MNWNLNNALTRRSRAWLLLIAAAFLFAQAETLGHAHTGGESSTQCVTCVHADSADLLTGVPTVALTTIARGEATPAPASSGHVDPLDFDRLSRAPPKST